MTEYNNPFYTLREAFAILKTQGASPTSNLPADQVDWREQILSVMTFRQYRGTAHYFVVSIHIEYSGFIALRGVLEKNFDVVRSEHSDEYDKIAMYLDHEGYLFEVMALVPKEESK